MLHCQHRLVEGLVTPLSEPLACQHRLFQGLVTGPFEGLSSCCPNCLPVIMADSGACYLPFLSCQCQGFHAPLAARPPVGVCAVQ